MDVKKLTLDFFSADETGRKKIMSEIAQVFNSLSPEEQHAVQNIFLEKVQEKTEEMKPMIDDIKLRLTLEEISQFVSLSYIAKHYFNKSRSWLHNKMKGYLVNGKNVSFTPDEAMKLKNALKDISQTIEKASVAF